MCDWSSEVPEAAVVQPAPVTARRGYGIEVKWLGRPQVQTPDDQVYNLSCHRL